MEKNDLVFFFAAIAWVQLVSYLLLTKQCKSGNRRWWMLPDKRERPHLGAYTTLFLKYKHTNHEEFFKMTRLTVEQFEELLNLIRSALIKTSMRESLDPEFRLAFTLWYVYCSIKYVHLHTFYLFSIKLHVCAFSQLSSIRGQPSFNG